MDIGDGIYEGEYKLIIFIVESKRVIRRIDREDICDSLGNTILNIDFIEHFHSQ